MFQCRHLLAVAVVGGSQCRGLVVVHLGEAGVQALQALTLDTQHVVGVMHVRLEMDEEALERRSAALEQRHERREGADVGGHCCGRR